MDAYVNGFQTTVGVIGALILLLFVLYFLGRLVVFLHERVLWWQLKQRWKQAKKAELQAHQSGNHLGQLRKKEWWNDERDRGLHVRYHCHYCDFDVEKVFERRQFLQQKDFEIPEVLS